MKRSRYQIEIIEDHASADFVFNAFGITLADLFEACAIATFSVMTDINKVKSKFEKEINLHAEDSDELLYSFISELIYLKDVEKAFFSKFQITLPENDKTLSAIVRGEHIDYEKHIIKTDVKAVTFHELKIKYDNGLYRTRMILDL